MYFHGLKILVITLSRKRETKKAALRLLFKSSFIISLEFIP
ncbi:hypothetical protein JCM19296_2678 [Nonlabens ulvanivorans]|uniref:Uncharacterized protein n=1 Tax=Nonlabens ulvanivorans TaxID=906888 RepID=A0A081DDS8_NONUL|nr:hypothetical protein JCM19296_2678 [Nonlabens ulvanivorans]